MPDNVTAQSGSNASVPAGTVIATDEIAGLHYQRIKQTFGADGSATDVSTTSPLPVYGSVLPSSQWTVSVTPSTQFTVTTTPSSNASVTLTSGTQQIGTVAPALKTTSSLTNVVVSSSSSGENTLVSGTASQTIRVFRGQLQTLSSAAMSLMDATGGTTLAKWSLNPGGIISFDSFDSGEPAFVTASSGALIVNLDTAAKLRGFIQYVKS